VQYSSFSLLAANCFLYVDDIQSDEYRRCKHHQEEQRANAAAWYILEPYKAKTVSNTTRTLIAFQAIR